MKVRFTTPKLTFQLAACVGLFVMIIECIALWGNYEARRLELQSIETAVAQTLEQYTGKEISQPLGEGFTQEMLTHFLANSIIVTFSIILVIASGTMAIFYFIAGRHLSILTRLNKLIKGKKAIPYPEAKIPNNEIGLLIRGRNKMLADLTDYQNNLSKNLEEAKFQLIQSGRMSAIGELTSTIAHDMRNPLSVVYAYSDQISREASQKNPDMVTVRDRAKKIFHAAQAMNHLVERMNEFNQTELQFKEGNDLPLIVSQALILVSTKLERYKVKIENHLSEKLPPFWGEENSIEQVVMNLLSNACDALSSQKIRKIILSARSNDEFIYLTVKDTGAGIPNNVAKTLFQPFVTTKSKGQGSGLGLSICYQVATRHHGSINIEPNTGEGASFILRLRRHQPHEPQVKAA